MASTRNGFIISATCGSEGDCAPAVAAKRVDERIARDRVEPGLEGARGVVGVPCAVHRHEGVLHEILDLRRLADAAPEVAPQVGRDALEEVSVGVFVAVLRPRHPGGPLVRRHEVVGIVRHDGSARDGRVVTSGAARA